MKLRYKVIAPMSSRLKGDGSGSALSWWLWTTVAGGPFMAGAEQSPGDADRSRHANRRKQAMVRIG
jgi:hypothetical protein